jgi:hypothetical protein
MTAISSGIAENIADVSNVITNSAEGIREVAATAGAIQDISDTLGASIPEMVHRAVKADLREHPRYNVDLTATITYRNRTITTRVFDVSEGGLRIDRLDFAEIGDFLTVVFDGMRAIEGHIVRETAGNEFGVSFAPATLRLEELRDLVTQAA